MFIDRNALRDSAFGLVGFEQTSNPAYPLLSASLLVKRSGRVVNEESGLLTIENIDQTVKNFSHYSYTAYNAATEYSLGMKMVVASVNYEYINATPSTGNAAPNATYWAVIDNLSDYLIKASKKGFDNAIDAVLRAKKMSGKIRSIYENVLLYDGLVNPSSFVTNADNFVGLRLRMKKDRSLITIINKIGTHFSTILTGNLTLSLYHSSQQAAIETFVIAPASAAKQSQWTAQTTGNILRYLSSDYDAGGDFYLGYKQSDLADLGGQAMRKALVWGESCNCANDAYSNYSAYVDIMGFQVAETEMVADALFDTSKITLVSSNNFGLNLNISQKCDLTDFILQEEDLLGEAVSLHVALKILSDMASSTRGTNAVASQVSAMAQKELFHHKEAWGTVADRASAAAKAVSFDLSGMNDDCLPHEDYQVRIGGVKGRIKFV